MSDWSNFKNLKGGSGDILKLEDGKAYKLRIIGEPFVYQSEFKGDLSTRFALTVYNQTDKKAQIVMIPRGAFGTIYELVENEDWGDPEEYDITIKRTGSGLETEYNIAPSPKKAIEPAKRAEVEAINLEDVLKRLPSVQFAFPLSQTDPEQLLPAKAKKTIPKGLPADSEEIQIEDIEQDMPENFLQ